jgi:hypothetical protein
MKPLWITAALLLLALPSLSGEGAREKLQYTLSYVTQSPEVKLASFDGSAEGQASLYRPSWGELRILDVNLGVASIPILYGTTLAKTDDGTYFTFFPLRIGFPVVMSGIGGQPFAWGVILSAELDWNRLNAKDVYSASQKFPLLDARITVTFPVLSAYVSFRKTVFNDTPTRAALFDGLFFGVDLALGSPIILDLSSMGAETPVTPEHGKVPVEGDFRYFQTAEASYALYREPVPTDSPAAERTIAVFGFYRLSASARSGGTLSVIVRYPGGSGAEWRIAADDYSQYLSGRLSDRDLGQAIRIEKRNAAEMEVLVR